MVVTRITTMLLLCWVTLKVPLTCADELFPNKQGSKEKDITVKIPEGPIDGWKAFSIRDLDEAESHALEASVSCLNFPWVKSGLPKATFSPFEIQLSYVGSRRRGDHHGRL